MQQKVKQKIGQIYTMRGKKQENISEVLAGDIAAVAKLQYTSTNDTLADKERPIILKGVDFPKPVLSLAAHPKAKGDEEKISTGLSSLQKKTKLLRLQGQ